MCVTVWLCEERLRWWLAVCEEASFLLAPHPFCCFEGSLATSFLLACSRLPLLDLNAGSAGYFVMTVPFFHVRFLFCVCCTY